LAYTQYTLSAGIDEKSLTCPKPETLLPSFIDIIYKHGSIIISVFLLGMQWFSWIS